MATASHVILLVCMSLVGLSTQYTSDKTLYIGSDCSNYQIHHVNEHETYEIVWKGGPIPSYCSIGFIGRDDGYMNEYKVCISTDRWSISSCGPTVKFEKGVISAVAEVYNCYITPSTWCGDPDDYVDVVFEGVPTTQSGRDDEIRLKVTATMTYNYTLTIGIAVGGSVGGLFFLVLFIVLVSRAKARRRSHVILTSGYSGPMPAQGLANPVMYATPTSGCYPETYKPPPSYESVMNCPPYTPPAPSTTMPAN